MDRKELIELQVQAAEALNAGANLAAQAASKWNGRPSPSDPDGKSLGALLGNPAAFWSGAAAVEGLGDGETVEPMVLAVKYAAARIESGDLSYARESLIGQAQWASVLAVKLAHRANSAKHEQATSLIKLALAAQRQASAAIATAAALNKIQGATGVTVGDAG